MKRSVPVLGSIVAGLLASGCARAVVTTEVTAGGDGSRTLQFQGKHLEDLQQYFALPRGAPWKTGKEWKHKEAIYTARRALRRGERVWGDLVVRESGAGPGARRLSNEMFVREVAPGRLEYREVLHWLGQRPKVVESLDPQFVRRLRAALPAARAADAETRVVVRAVLRDLWRIWYGPGDPLLNCVNSDVAKRRLRSRLTAAIDRRLSATFVARMTPAERRDATGRWVSILLAAARRQEQISGAAGPIGSSGSSWVSLEFAVKLPGSVVATNGDYDAATQSVFWDLYSEAPAVGDVVLTATCDRRPASERLAVISRQTYANQSPQRVNRVPVPSPSGTSPTSAAARKSGA